MVFFFVWVLKILTFDDFSSSDLKFTQIKHSQVVRHPCASIPITCVIKTFSPPPVRIASSPARAPRRLSPQENLSWPYQNLWYNKGNLEQWFFFWVQMITDDHKLGQRGARGEGEQRMQATREKCLVPAGGWNWYARMPYHLGDVLFM